MAPGYRNILTTYQCGCPRTELKLLATDEKKFQMQDFCVSFVVSGVLAAVFKTVVAPLERIKLILQTQARSKQFTHAQRRNYTGVLNALARIPREQGILSLWRGNFTNIIKYMPSQAINFSFFDIYYRTLVKIVQPKSPQVHDVLIFLTGGTVGMTSCIIIYPLTFCMTRLAADVGDDKIVKREFSTLNDCLFKISKADGYRGFYRGLLPSLTGVFLYRSSYFGVYSLAKRHYLRDYTSDSSMYAPNVPLLVSLALAQVASTIATFVAYPFDTVSRQSMVNSKLDKMTSISMLKLMIKIIRRDGPSGLFRGVSANLVTSIGGTCVLAFYDLIMSYYLQLNKAKAMIDKPQ